MDSIIAALQQPTTFDSMTVKMVDRGIIKQIHEQGVANPRVFLSAWLISRFPNTLEDTPDNMLKELADSVVVDCLAREDPTRTLEVFEERFREWKGYDLSKLSADMYESYSGVASLSFDSSQDKQIQQEICASICEQARMIGITDLTKH